MESPTHLWDIPWWQRPNYTLACRGGCRRTYDERWQSAEYPGYCWKCVHGLIRSKAIRAIEGEVQAGRLPKVHTTPCVGPKDGVPCPLGKLAWRYAHRDYREPLDARPVCSRCWLKRPRPLPGSRPPHREITKDDLIGQSTLTLEEAAVWLDLPQRDIGKQIKAGKLPGYLTSNKKWRFDLDAHLHGLRTSVANRLYSDIAAMVEDAKQRGTYKTLRQVLDEHPGWLEYRAPRKPTAEEEGQ